ncbi:MAG: tetratricopeptide repeat protein, partial [Myxococcota bacterium]
MDRALSRTREVLEADPDHVEALRLQAVVYLERGWPLKARKPLQQLKDAGEDVGDLWARAHADPVRPEANAREIEREGNAAKLLGLAEGFLATGSFLRATGILERLRRNDPENARIKELLWSVAGDFGTGGQPLAALVASLVPAPSLPRENTAEEPEHTESLDLRASDLDPETGESTAFPALFKHAGAAGGRGDHDPHEETQASGLASRAEMGEVGGGGTDPGLKLVGVTNADASDTQILLVLRPGEERPGQVHRRREDGGESAAGLRDTLNLRAWQQSMGMSGGSDLADAPDDLLEEEDENVVVMTRGEAPAPAAPKPQPETFDKPIEVIEKHPTPAAPEVVEVEPEPTVRVARAPASGGGLRLVLVAGALAVLLFAAAALVVGGLATRSSSNDVRDDLVRALASADYNALLTQEGRLEQRIAGGVRASDVGEVRAALSEARLVLWSDYNGDPTRLAKAREALEEGAGLDVHRLAVLRAAEALARQDIAGAAAALGREKPEDDEERVLFARIAWRGGDLDRALEHLAAVERPDQPRYKLARAEILAEAGKAAEASALVDEVLEADHEHTAAATLRVELAATTPEQRVAA